MKPYLLIWSDYDGNYRKYFDDPRTIQDAYDKLIDKYDKNPYGFELLFYGKIESEIKKIS